MLDGAPCSEVLFSEPATLSTIDVDADDRIFTGAGDGIIRIHTREGTPVDAAFATGLGSAPPLRFGPGDGAWGDALYVVDRSSGQLKRFAPDGSFEVLGAGFLEARDIEFGPDGAMYLSMLTELRIIRVAPISCPTDLNSSGSTDSADLNILLADFGCVGGGCVGDIDGDGDTNSTDLNLLLAAFGQPCG